MNGLVLLIAAAVFNLVSTAELPQLYIKKVDLSKLPHVKVVLGNVSCPIDEFYGIFAALQFFSFNAADHFEYYAEVTCSEIVADDEINLTIVVENPDLAFFPEERVIYIDHAVVYAWLGEYENTGWVDARINSYLNFDYPDPLSRPKRSIFANIPKFECEIEQETVDVIKFPTTFRNSGQNGVLIALRNFTSPELENEISVINPRISVLVTIFLHDNCLTRSRIPFCSIFHAVRAGSDDENTPQLFLAQLTNEIVIQVVDFEDQALLSSYPTGIFLKPGLVHQILLAVNLYAFQITVTSWDPELSLKKVTKTRETFFDQRVHIASLRWPSSYLVFGGSDSFRSFEGFIDSATVFRTRFAYSTDSDVKSRRKLSTIGNLLALRLKSCNLIKTETTSCSRSNYLQINKKETMKLDASSEDLYLEALNLLEKGQKLDEMFEKLDLSGCLGSGQAEFLIGVLRRNETAAYLVNYLKASLLGYHFADLALGNYLLRRKNFEVAFRYVKSAAEVSQKLTAEHSSDDRWVDSIHLDNEEELEMHQDNDNGPIVAWLMYQAGMGDAGAMHDVARLFYLGAQGVDRDMGRAAELFRQAAADPNADPQLLYDYAVVLLHGRGVEPNRTLALKYLHRAADAGFGQAYGALGWYYMEKDGGNLTLAVPYLEKAAELDVPEAAHNIGWLLLNNMHPFKPGRQPGLAYGYFTKAAGLGSLEGALMASELIARGIPSIDLPPNATEACRYANAVASQSPRLGTPLRAALSSYLAGDMRKSFIHYSTAAEAGNDVAIFNAGYLCETEVPTLMASGIVPDEQAGKSCVASMFENAVSRPFIPKTSSPPHALLWLAREAADRNDLHLSANLYADALLAGADEGYYGLSWLAASRGYHIPAELFYRLILSDADHSLSQQLAELDPVDVALFLLDACMTVEEKGEDEELLDEEGYLSMNGKMKPLPEGYFACALYKFFIQTNQTVRAFDDVIVWFAESRSSFSSCLSEFWLILQTRTGLLGSFVVGFVIGVIVIFPVVAFVSSKLASIFGS